jgi:hypothetical protein
MLAWLRRLTAGLPLSRYAGLLGSMPVPNAGAKRARSASVIYRCGVSSPSLAANWIREVIPSFGKRRYRIDPMVRGER